MFRLCFTFHFGSERFSFSIYKHINQRIILVLDHQIERIQIGFIFFIRWNRNCSNYRLDYSKRESILFCCCCCCLTFFSEKSQNTLIHIHRQREKEKKKILSHKALNYVFKIDLLSSIYTHNFFFLCFLYNFSLIFIIIEYFFSV